MGRTNQRKVAMSVLEPDKNQRVWRDEDEIVDWVHRPIEEMVKNGVAFLDKEKPGWRDLINWSSLNMSDSDRCIIGQLFCDFRTTPLVASFKTFYDSKPNNWFIDHGFACGSHSYFQLQLEWEKQK